MTEAIQQPYEKDFVSSLNINMSIIYIDIVKDCAERGGSMNSDGLCRLVESPFVRQYLTCPHLDGEACKIK